MHFSVSPSPRDLVFVGFGTIMSYQYLRDANVKTNVTQKYLSHLFSICASTMEMDLILAECSSDFVLPELSDLLFFLWLHCLTDFSSAFPSAHEYCS